MKQVRCKSGLRGWQAKLSEVYSDFDQFRYYAEALGLHTRFGYPTPIDAWQDDPTVQGSVIPADSCKVTPFKRNTPANTRKMAWNGLD